MSNDTRGTALLILIVILSTILAIPVILNGLVTSDRWDNVNDFENCQMVANWYSVHGWQFCSCMLCLIIALSIVLVGPWVKRENCEREIRKLPSEITVVYQASPVGSNTINIKNVMNYSWRYFDNTIYSFDFQDETGELKNVKLIDPVYTEVDMETRHLIIYV